MPNQSFHRIANAPGELTVMATPNVTQFLIMTGDRRGCFLQRREHEQL
jgi:hypothetical protein